MPLGAAALLLLLISLSSCVTLVSRDELAAEYLSIANTLYEAGAVDQASTYYGRALDLNPELESASFNLARVYIDRGQYERGIAILEELLQERPESLELREARAFAALRSGDLERAEELYREILEESPYRVSALYNLGVLKRELEGGAEALDYFARAYEAELGDPDVSFAYGELLAGRGRVEEAIPVFETFLSAAETAGPRFLAVAEHLEAGAYYSRALTVYERYLRENPDSPNGHFARARLLLTVVEDEEAGSQALLRALRLGFSDGEELGTLLADPGLVAPVRVEEILEEQGFDPSALQRAAETRAREEAQAGAERADSAGAPTGRPYLEQVRP